MQLSLTLAQISSSERISPATVFTSSWVERSDNARSGSSWTSMKNPSTQPVAAAARARIGAYCLRPPVSLPLPGSWSECVTS